MITILRQYFTYDITNSCTFQVSLEISMRVEDQDYMLIPIKGIVSDLKIVNSKGTELVILSDSEFKELKGREMSDLRAEYLTKLKSGLKRDLKEYPDFINKYRIIAIMLSEDSAIGSYYDKISMTWNERFENRKRHIISEYVEIPINHPKYGVSEREESALYLSIKTNEKYQIYPDPDIINLASDLKPVYKIIMDDPRHKTYRFGDNFFTQIIQVNIKIGLPKTIRTWARLGLLSTIIAPTIIAGMVIYFRNIPEFGFETLFGTIGFVVGLRALVLHDVDLMKRWNKTLLYAVIGCAVLLFVLMLLESHFTEIQIRNIWNY